MGVVTDGYGIVVPPKAEPPFVGLIAALSGTQYLIDSPETFPPFEQPGLERGEPSHSNQPANPTQPRWAGGVRYLPEQVCNEGWVSDPCGTTTLVIPANGDVVNFIPFYAGTGDKCSAFGWEAHDFIGRASRALLAVQSKLIATELWKGAQAQASGWPNHYLASDAFADTLSAPNTPLSPAQALDVIEQGLADCGNGQRGVIYCTRQFGSFLSGLGNTLRDQNGRIVTYAGTIIIPDAGFDGSGPQGQPAVSGSQWAYATLIPEVRLSPIEVYPDTFEEAVIRGTNDIEWRAQRLASVTFPDCCHLAVNVDLPAVLVGGAS